MQFIMHAKILHYAEQLPAPPPRDVSPAFEGAVVVIGAAVQGPSRVCPLLTVAARQDASGVVVGLVAGTPTVQLLFIYILGRG